MSSSRSSRKLSTHIPRKNSPVLDKPLKEMRLNVNRNMGKNASTLNNSNSPVRSISKCSSQQKFYLEAPLAKKSSNEYDKENLRAISEGSFVDDTHSNTKCDDQEPPAAASKPYFRFKKSNRRAKVCVAEQELLEGKYEVKRVMKRTVDANGQEAFVVLWKNFNYTFCTLQSLDDLKGSPDELALLEQKEIGLNAIMEDLIRNQHKYNAPVEDLFVPDNVPDELPVGHRDIPDEYFDAQSLVTRHGYWKVKWIETFWNDTVMSYYARTRSRKIAPLYLEGWHSSAFKNLPKFDFIVDRNRWTRQAIKVKRQSNFNPCECCPFTKLCKLCRARHDDPLGIFTEIKNGLLQIKPKTMQEQYYWTYECSAFKTCNCYPKCEYRLLSRGRKVALVVFFELKKGWTIRALHDIPKGQFLSEYIGEIITMKEANRRDTSYQFEIGKYWFVDARHAGNESRFFSHSCNPNAFVVRVYGLNQVIHKIGVFALRDIMAGEEITFDYHPDYYPGEIPKSSGRCYCKEAQCRGWL